MCVNKVSRSSASCCPVHCPTTTPACVTASSARSFWRSVSTTSSVRLWGREGLSRRDRSLVTLGILIALRATDELKSHVQIARNNGLTEDEIAEVIYHTSGYAGFPAANTACRIAREVLDPDS